MSTSSRTDAGGGPAHAASDVADSLRDADFVRVLARADGDCLAAAGLLGRACADCDVPFQVRVDRFSETLADPNATEEEAAAERDDADGRAATHDDTTVGVGLDSAADAYLPAHATPASVTAFDAARDLDADPDPVLALAGVVAAEHPAGAGETAHVLEAARESGVERRPGVGVPTDDLADGLAHSTLGHAAYSGDPEATRAALTKLDLPADLDEEADADAQSDLDASARRRVASEYALAVAGDESATDRAGEAVERALGPHAIAAVTAGETDADHGHPSFATVEGYADVLDAVARERPGTATALALGHDARAAALDAWRTHAERAHAALLDGTTGRYDGLFVLRTEDAPVETVARLLRDFRSPEPVALVVAGSAAAVAAVEDAGVAAGITEAASAVGGTGGGTPRRGYARFDPGTDATDFLAAFREARP